MAKLMMVGVVMALATNAFGGYSEPWETGANDWLDGQVPPQPVTHVMGGGVGGGNHVMVDLATDVPAWKKSPTVDWMYFPNWYSTLDTGEHQLDFTGADVSIDVRGENVDLASGSLYFFVGWTDEAGTSAYYRHNTALTVGVSDWAHSSINCGTDDTDWTLMDESGTPPSFAAVLAAPNEYGFTITDVLDTDPDPSGDLHFDNFNTDARSIAEPAGLGVLGLTLLGWRRRRRE